MRLVDLFHSTAEFQDLTPYRGLNSPCSHSSFVSSKLPPCRCSRLAPFHKKELLPSRERVHSSRPRLRGLDPHRVTCRSSWRLAKTRIAPLFGFTSKSLPSSNSTHFYRSFSICRSRKRPRHTKINPQKSAIFEDDVLGISSLPFHRSNWPYLPAQAPCEARTTCFIDSRPLAAETTRNPKPMLSTALFRRTGKTNFLAKVRLRLDKIQLPKSTRRRPKTSPCSSEQIDLIEQRHNPFDARVKARDQLGRRPTKPLSHPSLSRARAPKRNFRKLLGLPKQTKLSSYHSPYPKQKLPSVSNRWSLAVTEQNQPSPLRPLAP